MKYWVFTGAAAIGPFPPEELAARAPGFGPETVVAPDGAGTADAWKPAKTFPELQTLFVKPPVVAPQAAAPAPAEPDGFFCPPCGHRIKTDDLCCANCSEVLPKDLRERYLASLGPAAGTGDFWRKYFLYVALGLAALIAAGAFMKMLSRRAARKAAAEEAKRAQTLPPISIKVAPAPAEPEKRRPEHRATLAQRRAKAPPSKSAADMSVSELQEYLDRGKPKTKDR